MPYIQKEVVERCGGCGGGKMVNCPSCNGTGRLPSTGGQCGLLKIWCRACGGQGELKYMRSVYVPPTAEEIAEKNRKATEYAAWKKEKAEYWKKWNERIEAQYETKKTKLKIFKSLCEIN